MVCGHPYSIPETGVRPAKHRPDQVTRGEFYPTVFSIARLFCELSVQNEKCLCVRLQLHPNRSEHFSPYAVLSPDKESIGIVTGCNRKLLLRYTGRRRGGRARLAGELRVSAAPRRKSGSYRGPRGFVAKRAHGDGFLSLSRRIRTPAPAAPPQPRERTGPPPAGVSAPDVVGGDRKCRAGRPRIVARGKVPAESAAVSVGRRAPTLPFSPGTRPGTLRSRG